MRNFTYARAEGLPAVVAGLGRGSTSILAGGTELLNWMRLGIAAPERVLDIGAVAELRGIRRERDALVIGAAATLNEVGENALVREHAPVLAQACLKAASAQIRDSAGRIVNPRTARSQMIGGIVWGWGNAVLEQSLLDEKHGAYLSKNLSGVMLPVNADIPSAIDVFFVDEHDPHASAIGARGIGARGIGELGATGVAAAITNAVWHATGKRIRRVPIRIDDIVA